jgi:hypothetical protein
MVKTRTDKKLECLLVIILLILSGFSIIGLIPVNLGAETDFEARSNVQQPVNSRSGRSIDYDMNLSRTGKHQDMTVYGRRGLLGSETISPITSLAMGDVTGDGFDDLIIGAAGDNLTLNENTGLVFVIFGKSPLPSTFDLALKSDLTIQGVGLNDLEGTAVAVGDINGDNINDIITGVPGADGQGDVKLNAGEVHIFYGGSYLKNINIWDQEVTNANVTIIGNSSSNSEDNLGSSLAVGNFNSDAYDDIIIGAPGGDGIDDQPVTENSGEVWIVYGSNTLPSIIDLESGGAVSTSTIFGVDSNDAFGTAVASGDDFNGDGIDDVAVTARFGEGPANSPASEYGEAYILFCRAIMPVFWNLPVTPANWTYFAAAQTDHLGYYSIALGDMNDDQYADIIVGAPFNDGPIGDRTDSGATYVFFGNDTNVSNQQWDLGILMANITVYFPNSNDQSGTWVEAFDWDDDDIDDIVIGAPLGFGAGNSYPGVGEVVIINGSQVYQDTQTQIDLQSESNKIKFFFFGADNIDSLGRFMTYGDLNGDTIMDIAIFADGADGFNNSKNNPGEVYIIRGETSKVPSFKSLKILNADVPIGASCYAELKPYEFEVNITSPLGILDLTNVTLVLDPLGLGLKYMWDRSTDTFSELNDPNDYAELNVNSNSTNNGNDNWTLGFNIEFNWACPRFDTPKPVSVILYNSINYYVMTNYDNMFTLENRLNFTGNLMVKGDDGRTLSNNDWVGRGETLTWSGLMAVYDGTIDVYPNTNDYNVNLWNATRSWLGTSQPGQPINIQSQTGTQSLASDDYLINITGIPTASDVSNITFSLRLDAENIGYSNNMPSFDDWQNTSTVNCGVTITDTGGAFVNASSIQYRTSFDNGSIWSNWTFSGASTDDTSIQASNDIYFINGIYNKIQWRGNDTLDNGYELSPAYRLKVDTENITFSRETPKSTELTTTDVQFGITISDEISGVNESTIEYAFTTDDGTTWSDWKDVNLTGVNNTVKVVVNEKFSPGTTNWVKWRASDVAGNVNETEPRQFNISIPTKELWVRLVNPENNTEVPSGSQTLEWYTNDNSSNVKFKVYLSKLELFDLSLFQPNTTDLAEKSYDTDVLENNETYYWTVIPYKGGEVGYCIDGYWSFYINPEAQKLDHPIVEVINPPNGSEQLTLTPTFSWTLKYKKTTGARFDIYLGESPDVLSLYKAGLTKKSYTVPSTDPLDNHKTYYWRVHPHSGPIPASEDYMSPIWNFHINTTKIIKETYDFSITTSDSTSITLKQGGNKEITINVVNLKNAETVYMVISGNIASSIFSFTPESISLGKDETKPVTLKITIPKDFKPGDYTFKAVGEMRVSGDVLTNEIAFTLTVEKKDDGGGGGGGDDNFGMIIGIVAVVIIIIIVLVLLMMMKRKKKAQAEPEEERMEPEGVEMEGEAPPMAAPMAAPIAEPISPLEPAMPTEEVPPEELPPLPPTETPEAPAPAAEEAPEAAEAPPAEAEVPTAEQQPQAIEPTEPDMPGDLPPDAYEKPPEEPAAAPPAAPAEPVTPAPAAPAEPAPAAPAEPTQPTEPAAPESAEQAEPKPGEKPKDDENA